MRSCIDFDCGGLGKTKVGLGFLLLRYFEVAGSLYVIPLLQYAPNLKRAENSR